MAQRIAVWGMGSDKRELRTASKLRYIVLVAHPHLSELLKAKSSDNLATATRELDRIMRRESMRHAVGVVVDLVSETKIAQLRGRDALHVGSLEVVVRGQRGR